MNKRQRGQQWAEEQKRFRELFDQHYGPLIRRAKALGIDVSPLISETPLITVGNFERLLAMAEGKQPQSVQERAAALISDVAVLHEHVTAVLSVADFQHLVELAEGDDNTPHYFVAAQDENGRATLSPHQWVDDVASAIQYASTVPKCDNPRVLMVVWGPEKPDGEDQDA